MGQLQPCSKREGMGHSAGTSNPSVTPSKSNWSCPGPLLPGEFMPCLELRSDGSVERKPSMQFYSTARATGYFTLQELIKFEVGGWDRSFSLSWH